MEPDDYWTWYQRGAILHQLERFSEAIVSCDRALNLEQRFDLAWYQKSCCYAKLDNPNHAIMSLEQAINLDPHKYLDLAANEAIWSKYLSQTGFQLLLSNKSRKYLD